MPRYLTYSKLKTYYEKHGCKLAIDESTFTPNVTKNHVPYYCPQGHLIENLTKNTFNARINQGRNPCTQCSIKAKALKRRNQVSKALAKKGCKLLDLNRDRSIAYVCKCGKSCKSYDNNVLKPGFIGCTNCANPFNRKEVQDAIKKKHFEKYGCENPFQREDIKKKIKNTNIQRYGCENVMQNKVIFSRNMGSAYQRKKEYVFPSGRIEYVLGYEPRCIDLLLKDYHEDDIVTNNKKMPDIWYINPLSNKRCKYFPDIFIPRHKVLIEVKSDYYYIKDLEKNHAKFHATVKAGFDLHLYVFNKKILLYRKTYNKEGVTSCPSPTG